MEYRTLGRTGLKVSEISLGCWTIGGPAWKEGRPIGWGNVDDEESVRALRRGFDLGMNHFDTADIYGIGHSEQVLGRVLPDLPRDEIVVATKVGLFAGTAASPYDPLHIRHQCEQSLQNLGLDHIDIYYLHNGQFGPDDEYMEPAAETLRTLRDEGKIRFIGQSSFRYSDFPKTLPVVDPDVLQLPYSLMSRGMERPGSDALALAGEHNLGAVLFSVLAKGLLLGKYDADKAAEFGEGDIRLNSDQFKEDFLRRFQDKMEKVKARFGDDIPSLGRMAMQFALRRPEASCVIAGFRNTEQIEVNAQAAGRPLDENDVAFLDELFPVPEPREKT